MRKYAHDERDGTKSVQCDSLVINDLMNMPAFHIAQRERAESAIDDLL